MRYFSITEARQQLASLVSGTEPTMIIRNNKPVAALLSIQEYESLLASEARERDPKRLARLTRAHLDLQAGRPRAVTDFSQGSVDDLLKLADQAVETLEAEDENARSREGVAEEAADEESDELVDSPLFELAR